MASFDLRIFIPFGKLSKTLQREIKKAFGSRRSNFFLVKGEKLYHDSMWRGNEEYLHSGSTLELVIHNRRIVSREDIDLPKWLVGVTGQIWSNYEANKKQSLGPIQFRQKTSYREIENFEESVLITNHGSDGKSDIEIDVDSPNGYDLSLLLDGIFSIFNKVVNNLRQKGYVL